MKLLLAEDEISMSEALVDILTYHNYQVDAVFDGADALSYAQLESYDGIILDVMMPQKNGFEVLAELRQAGCQTPILLLTAKSELEDRIHGLDLSADDYLPKPFAAGELLARVRAMLRRRVDYKPNILYYGDIALNPQSYELNCQGTILKLSRQEGRLLEALLLNQGVYLSSEQLLVKVWGYETEADLGSVWVYISYLRKRLQESNSQVKIKMKRNLGYTLESALC